MRSFAAAAFPAEADSAAVPAAHLARFLFVLGETGLRHLVGRCRLAVSNPSRKRAWFQRLKLNCDEALSNFAFNFNLRRYNLVHTESLARAVRRARVARDRRAADSAEAGAYTRPLLISN